MGLLGGTLGSLTGIFAPRGKAKSLVLGLYVISLLGSVLLLIAGSVAYLTGQPYGVWYGLGFPGLGGTVIFGSLLPMTSGVYRQAEQRRLAARDL